MTSEIVSPRKKPGAESRRLSPEQAAAAAMVAEARQRGLELTGPDGLLKLFTKNVLETALNEELTEHLGHEKTRPIRAVSRRMYATVPGRKRWYRTRPVKCPLRCPAIVKGRSSRRS